MEQTSSSILPYKPDKVYNKYETILKSENYWKLLIPGKDHDKGENAYEITEPGYIKNMEEALEYVLYNIYSKCSLSLYMNIAGKANSNKSIKCSDQDRARSIYSSDNFSDEYLLSLIKNAQSENPSIILQYPTKKGGIKKKMSLKDDSKIVLNELKKAIEEYSVNDTLLTWGKIHRPDASLSQLHFIYAYGTIGEKKSMYNYRYIREPEIEWISVGENSEKKITDTFNQYETDMLLDQSEKERLLRIITLVHYLNGILHVFLDGNLRVNGHLIFHKELIRFNFKPINLETYMIFETKSPSEIYEICEPLIFSDD